MKIEQAIEILNDRNHRDYNFWELNGYWVIGVIPITIFEAIAIAEKYERKSQ